MGQFSTPSTDGARTSGENDVLKEKEKINKAFGTPASGGNLGAPQHSGKQGGTSGTTGSALTDTPLTTAPNSPIMWVDPMPVMYDGVQCS